MARPTTCTPEVVEAVCARIETGSTLHAACDAEGIGKRTWLKHMDADEKASREYTFALKARAEYFEAEHDRIAKTAIDKESAAAARVQLQALEWKMQRMAPSRYGDRVDVNVDHRLDLGSVLDQRRQRVIEANEKLGLPNGGDSR